LTAVGCRPPPGLDALSIVSERLVAAVPANRPRAQLSRVTLADISAHPMGCMPTGTGIRTVFDRARAAKGLRPTVALQASAPAPVADLAVRGLGVAILCESTTARYDGTVTGLVIEDVDIPAVLALIWRTTTSPLFASCFATVATLGTTARRRLTLPHSDASASGLDQLLGEDGITSVVARRGRPATRLGAAPQHTDDRVASLRRRATTVPRHRRTATCGEADGGPCGSAARVFAGHSSGGGGNRTRVR